MNLEEFFLLHDKVALAFSGGVDSAYLLYEAVRHGVDIRPYYVKSQFQPQFELDDSMRLCNELGVELCILELDVLSNPSISSNCDKRCYFCKKEIMGAIKHKAIQDGYDTIVDGSNASDLSSDRPGMLALDEEGVLSPLRLAGLDKAMIRELSRRAGLFTWNKAAYACLATRIPSGTELTEELLERTEKAEDYLSRLGFKDFRVRCFHDAARIQICASDFQLFMDNKDLIYRNLSELYPYGVVLDLNWRG